MVNKDNQILLNKLVEISNGKWGSVATAEMARTGNKRGQSQAEWTTHAVAENLAENTFLLSLGSKSFFDVGPSVF